jgi:RNA polymerase sigma factor (sigma-70 family)
MFCATTAARAAPPPGAADRVPRPSPTPSPEEQVLRREEVGCLLEALADLPAADRELVSLRYGSGLSTAEVAEVLGVREPAVRTRLWRALGRLRKAMRP